MVIKGFEAFCLIESENLRIRDSLIESYIIEYSNEAILFKMFLIDKIDNLGTKRIGIHCSDISALKFSSYEDDPSYLEDFKIDYNTETMEYYFSFDPDSSIATPTETDCNFVYFKDLSITVSE